MTLSIDDFIRASYNQYIPDFSAETFRSFTLGVNAIIINLAQRMANGPQGDDEAIDEFEYIMKLKALLTDSSSTPTIQDHIRRQMEQAKQAELDCEARLARKREDFKAFCNDLVDEFYLVFFESLDIPRACLTHEAMCEDDYLLFLHLTIPYEDRTLEVHFGTVYTPAWDLQKGWSIHETSIHVKGITSGSSFRKDQVSEFQKTLLGQLAYLAAYPPVKDEIPDFNDF
ncbi:hypothetical protein [Nodosilinea nodulosa]|uniref:hypothetical protein n=1 Tax=Nodosilinea nodulosa TaxID=416001 RepID=UPI0003787BEA|nr:hypothetical protein [Nodosilinea nodulosa]